MFAARRIPSSEDWPVPCRLSNKVLRVGVVNCNNREPQNSVVSHGLEADDAGRRLFHAAKDRLVHPLTVQDGGHVRTVVEDQVRFGIEHCADVLVERLSILTTHGVYGNSRIHQAAATSSCVESGLDAHKVTSAPPATSVSMRFAVSEVTCMHAPMRYPASGFVLLESFPDRSENWHSPAGPFDSQVTLLGEPDMCDVVVHVHPR